MLDTWCRIEQVFAMGSLEPLKTQTLSHCSFTIIHKGGAAPAAKTIYKRAKNLQ